VTLYFLAFCLAAFSVPPATAIDWSLFKDPDDGALDLSEWLLSRGGFLPVPIIITEPAVGAGLGLAAVFFHGNLSGTPNPGNPDEYLPPSMTIGAAAYTSNDTWFAGGGHIGHWRQDSIRYTGFIGILNLNLDFYAGDNPLAFNIDGGFLLQQVKFRLGRSDFFIGGKYILFDSTSVFEGLEGALPPDFPDIDLEGWDATNSGLGVVGYYDGRDTIFTPSRGQEANLEILRYDEAIGGDFDYWYLAARVLSFHQMHEDFVLGLRADGEAVDGDVPFFAFPFVQLRGVPAMRYQDERVLNIEVEGRWRVWKRWSLIGFLGTGLTDGDVPRFDTKDDIITWGGGFRYLAARQLGLHVGIDVGRGPEDTAVYLQMGHAWAR
jgi:hypothetical protein